MEEKRRDRSDQQRIYTLPEGLTPKPLDPLGLPAQIANPYLSNATAQAVVCPIFSSLELTPTDSNKPWLPGKTNTEAPVAATTGNPKERVRTTTEMKGAAGEKSTRAVDTARNRGKNRPASSNGNMVTRVERIGNRRSLQ